MNLKTEEWQQTVYARIQSQLKSLGRLTPDLLQKTKTVTAVMNTYKVSLENMLCDTDIKEQVHFRGRNISILHLVNRFFNFKFFILEKLFSYKLELRRKK